MTHLTLVGAVWKLSGDKADSPSATRGVESMERIGAAIETFTEDVSRGEFRSAEEAIRSMRRRIGPVRNQR